MTTASADAAPPRPEGRWLATFASVSRLHIVAIAAMGTLTFGWLFTGMRPWLLAGICALDWFVVNLLNRVVDLEEDEVNAIYGTGFVARHRRALITVGFGVLAASLVASSLWIPTLTPWRLGYHALGLSYNWRLLPGRRRIKELYFFKNTASAVGFLITVFAYPLVASTVAFPPGITTTTVAVAGAFFFLFELSYEVLYDLRDAEGDAKAGVRTYALVHGEATALRIVDGLAVTSSAILVGGYALGVVPWRLFVMVLAPVMQVVIAHRAVRRGITADDCIRLTWLGAALLASYNLWIALGLPGVSA